MIQVLGVLCNYKQKTKCWKHQLKRKDHAQKVFDAHLTAPSRFFDPEKVRAKCKSSCKGLCIQVLKIKKKLTEETVSGALFDSIQKEVFDDLQNTDVPEFISLLNTKGLELLEENLVHSSACNSDSSLLAIMFSNQKE